MNLAQLRTSSRAQKTSFRKNCPTFFSKAYAILFVKKNGFGPVYIGCSIIARGGRTLLKNGPNQLASKFKKVQVKKTREIKYFFREIAILAVLNFFPSSKIDFWPILKWQKMEFGQNKISWN